MATYEVTPEERDCLSILRAVLGFGASEAVRGLLARPSELPPRLSPPAMEVFQRTLRRGVVFRLMKAGGWRQGMSWTAQGGVRRGRGWEREAPPRLDHSPFSLELCRWLTNEPLTTPGCTEAPALPAGRLGDELLALWTCELFLTLGLPRGPLAPLVAHSAFIALALPEMVGEMGGKAEEWAASLLTEGRDTLAGLMQGALREHLVRWVRGLLGSAAPSSLLESAECLEQALRGLVQVAKVRPDLATFVLEAADEVLPRPLDAGAGDRRWQPTFSDRTPFHQRRRILRALGTLPATVLALESEHERQRHTGFVDEGHEQAQALLVQWSHAARTNESNLNVFERARAVHRELSRLGAGANS